MNDHERQELRALLTIAATAEAMRLAARERGDTLAEAQAVGQLRQIWARHSELEAASRAA